MAVPAAQLPTQRDDRPTDDQVVVLRGLAWADWRRLVEARGDRPVPRMAYVDGAVELMSPSRDHERIKSILGSLVEVWAEHVGIEVSRLGSWTLEHAPRAGVEPDECFEVVRDDREPGVRPDLAIEVVWTSGRISKLEAYRALGVPEVWVWRNDALRVFVLRDEGYEEVGASEVLAGIDLQVVVSLLGERSVTAACRRFRQRLASEVP
jgi:Uma2 family endonuclease